MKKKYAIALNAALLSGMLLVNGCKEEDVLTNNVNSIVESAYFRNLNELNEGLTAVYAGLQRPGLYRDGFQSIHLYASDEAATTRSLETFNQYIDGKQYLNHNYRPNGESDANLSRNYWSDSYITIYRASYFLEKTEAYLPKATEAERPVIERMIGEAKFIRAFCYFNLVVDYGPVPLRRKTNDPTVLAASPAEEIYSYLETELADAKTRLWDRTTLLKTLANTGRIQQAAATALLGKVYLYQKKYTEAAAQFQEIVSSGQYSLVPNYQDNFLENAENNTESIFEIQFRYGLNGTNQGYNIDAPGSQNNPETNQFNGNMGPEGHGNFNARPSVAIVTAFETGDPRKDVVLYTPTSRFILNPTRANGSPDPDYSPDNTFGKTFDRLKSQVTQDKGQPADVNAGYAIQKWNTYDLTKFFNDENSNLPATGRGGINQRVIRYADVLLMLAEAKLAGSAGPNAEAASLINQVRLRARAGKSDVLPDVQGSFEDLIHERQVELAYEQVRRRDVIRWGLGPEYFPNFIAGKHETFPYPESEINSNPEMKQKPGY